jgi:amino acid transporter
VPFLTVSDTYLGRAAVVAWIAGIASVLAALVAGTNSQARMLYDGGRSKMLPPWLGRLRPQYATPTNALIAMAAIGLGIIGVWALFHVLGVGTGSMNPVGLYAECSTMGTIVILVVYLLTSISLPVFMWKRHRSAFSPFRHVAVPTLGAIALIVPFVELCNPGQPAPYDVFPYIALGLVAAAASIAWVVVRLRPSTGAGEGSTIAES